MRNSRLVLSACIAGNFLFLVQLLWAVPIFAMQVRGGTETKASVLVVTKIHSPSLEGNKLGDSADQEVAIYLPPSYQSRDTARFPSVYLLHGFNGNIRQWTTSGFQGLNLRRSMNTLIREGKIKEMIIVVPNGDNAYQGSFYTNSSVTGNWEDSVVRDLVSYVDTHYRTIRSAESRGIAGHSMGGYASIVIGMKQPDVFGTVYAMSPCCMIMEADMTADQNPAWKKALGIKDRGKLVKDPETIDDFYVDAIIALPAAFSPNPQKGPLFVDFPYADQAGKLVTKEPGWSEWEQKMPTVIEPEFKDNLKKLHGLWIECGIQDDFPHIPLGVRALPAELTRDGVPHVVAVYTGDHQDHIRERLETSALPFFSRVLKSSDVPDASH